MTNFEFYKEKLLQLDNEGDVACGVKKGHIKPCREVECLECELYTADGDSCYFNFWKWLASEHIDKPKLTRQEKAFLELLDPNCYLARNECKSLYVFGDKPLKKVGFYSAWQLQNIKTICMRLDLIFRAVKFDFIKWEDAEPWKVADLLELEVEEDVD